MIRIGFLCRVFTLVLGVVVMNIWFAFFLTNQSQEYPYMMYFYERPLGKCVLLIRPCFPPQKLCPPLPPSPSPPQAVNTVQPPAVVLFRLLNVSDYIIFIKFLYTCRRCCYSTIKVSAAYSLLRPDKPHSPVHSGGLWT